MKKIFGIGVFFAGALLLTGCGGSNTFTCTVEYAEGEDSMTQEVVTYLDKDDKVESYDIIFNMSSEESAETMYQMYVNSDIGTSVIKNGKKVTVKDAQKVEGSELDIVGKTKDEVKSIVKTVEPQAVCK